jgi:membrane protein YdbS with pleckstrin-like domain
MKMKLVRNQTQKRSRMKRLIKSLLIFLSLSGAMIFVFNIMNAGLGKRWDEIGLVIFVLIAAILILDNNND